MSKPTIGTTTTEKGLVNHKHWAIFRLMGLEDEAKQKKLIPFIDEELSKGYLITTIFQEIMEAEQGKV